MSDLNELLAELKAEIAERIRPDSNRYEITIDRLFEIDNLINNGEFARAEQDAYIG